MADQPGPLTADDLVEINNKLRELDRADKEIERAIRGGIDMTGQKEKAAELRKQLTKLKTAYFPGK